MTPPDQPRTADSALRDLRASIDNLAPPWLPPRRAIIMTLVFAAIGYALTVVAALLTIGVPAAAIPVINAAAPIGLAMNGLRAVSARRLRRVLNALDAPAYSDIKSEIVKHTHGMHRSTAAGVSLLFTFAGALFIGNVFMSIIVSSIALSALAHLFAITCLVCGQLLFARRFVELRDWLDGVVCARCGYDLRGNTSGRCPECGTGIPDAPNS